VSSFKVHIRQSSLVAGWTLVVGTDSSAGSDEIVICPLDGSACRNLTKGFLAHWFNDRVYF
jgi:hypothetical protein